MKFTLKALAVLFCICVSMSAMSNDTSVAGAKPAKESTQDKYDKVVEEYKKYATSVDKNVLKEVQEFRSAVNELNKRKQALYKRLSQDAQKHLAVEREYKRKLPVKARKEINSMSDSIDE